VLFTNAKLAFLNVPALAFLWFPVEAHWPRTQARHFGVIGTLCPIRERVAHPKPGVRNPRCRTGGRVVNREWVGLGREVAGGLVNIRCAVSWAVGQHYCEASTSCDVRGGIKCKFVGPSISICITWNQPAIYHRGKAPAGIRYAPSGSNRVVIGSFDADKAPRLCGGEDMAVVNTQMISPIGEWTHGMEVCCIAATARKCHVPPEHKSRIERAKNNWSKRWQNEVHNGHRVFITYRYLPGSKKGQEKQGKKQGFH